MKRLIIIKTVDQSLKFIEKKRGRLIPYDVKFVLCEDGVYVDVRFVFTDKKGEFSAHFFGETHDIAAKLFRVAFDADTDEYEHPEEPEKNRSSVEEYRKKLVQTYGILFHRVYVSYENDWMWFT